MNSMDKEKEMAQDKKRITVTTPIGEAKWFQVHKVDKFGNYTVELHLDDSPASHKFVDAVDRFGEGKKPITAKADGGYKVKLRSKSSGVKKTGETYQINPPAIYNSLGKRLSNEEVAMLNVGNGSKIRANVELSTYDFNGKGVKLGLKSLQLVEVLEFGDIGFEAVAVGRETEEEEQEYTETSGDYDF